MTVPPAPARPAPPRADAVGGALSLEWKLPILMTGLLALGLAVMISLTYATLVRRAEHIVRERLESAVKEIAASAAASIRARGDALAAVARAPALAAALRAAAASGPAPAPAGDPAVRAALARGLAPRDSALPIELWDREGRRVGWAGRDLPERMRTARPLGASSGASSGAPGEEGAARVGPLHPLEGRVRFWVAVPVVAGGDTLGWVAQLRNVGGPAGATRSLRQMLHEEVALYTRNTDDSVWAAAPGEAVPAPTSRDSSTHGVWLRHAGGRRALAAEAPIAGTPWTMVLESPYEWIVQRPRATIRPLALAALAIVVAGAVVAWVASRMITRPLAALTLATEAVAHGEYEARFARAGRDEIGRLAGSFDAMARRVAVAHEELARRAEEAEEANRAKTNFLSTMSHELRTPLNAIAGYVQLLEMGLRGPVTAQQREDLARIRRSQQHLLALINDVLSFARIGAGRIEYALGDVPMTATLAELEALVGPQMREAALEFVCRPGGEPLVARADADKVRQILLNLLGNAAKYTPPGGRITVACGGDERFVHVHVSDTGTGIRGERLSAIFEPFVQGERALNRPDEGVGLGLAISRELARGMGGDVTVESEPGRGSTFTLRLPRAGVSAPGTVATAPARAATPTAG